MNIDHYKKLSLTEGVTAADIADTDEIVSVIIDQKQLNSLAYQICDVQPLNGPTGAQFSVQYDNTTKKTSVVKSYISIEDDSVSDTGFTLESIQDMQSQFGKDAIGFIGKTFSGISSSKENEKLITKIDGWAKASTKLTLSNPENAETNMLELAQKVGELVVKLNSINYRTLDAFAIIPHQLAGTVLGIGSYFTDEQQESGLFMAKSGRIKYYVNPDPTSTTAYVGLNGKTPGNSSIIFSPYQHTLLTAQDPDSGETNIFNVNRYAMSLNSLSVTDNEMIYKFAVEDAPVV